MLIRYFAAAAQAAGSPTQEVDAAELDAASLVTHLGADNPALASLLQVCALLADGVRVEGDTPLENVTQLDVLPPFAGG